MSAGSARIPLWMPATSLGVGGETRADRPDRFVGDPDRLAARLGRQRASQLPNDHGGLLARLAFRLRLANADNRREAGLQRRFRLGADGLISLMVIGPALGVPNDHISRAGVLEHRGRDVAGESAAGLGGAVLAPQAEIGALDPEGGLRDQRRRRTDEQFGGAGFPRVHRLPDRVDLGQRAGKAIHLPISGDQRPYARGHSGLSATLIGGCYHRPLPLQSHRFAYAKHASAAREGALRGPKRKDG